MKFTNEVIHDSMAVTSEPIQELRGVRIGQIVKGKKITHITLAGEAIFEDGMWDYVNAINGTNPDL